MYVSIYIYIYKYLYMYIKNVYTYCLVKDEPNP